MPACRFVGCVALATRGPLCPAHASGGGMKCHDCAGTGLVGQEAPCAYCGGTGLRDFTRRTFGAKPDVEAVDERPITKEITRS